MTTIDLTLIESGLEALSGINFTAALDAFRSANVQGELTTAEDVASVVAVFVPEASYVKDALVVLSFIIAARQQGLIAPALVESPAMSRVERPTGGR